MIKNTKNIYPDWVLKQKRPRTEIHFINKKYYCLYESKTIYNKQTKKTKKVTGKYLGRIVENGLIPAKSKSKKIEELKGSFVKSKNMIVKEFGASDFFLSSMENHITRLQKYFPNLYAEIATIAFFRLLKQAPLKNISFLFLESFLSEKFINVTLNEDRISDILKFLGENRLQIINFCREDIHIGENILFDITNIPSNSENLETVKIGYNSEHDFTPQTNMMMVFSQTAKMPIFYRLLPGNIRDVSAFKLSIQEAGIKDAIIVADKGFYSKENIAMLEENNLKYIIPLRRTSELIDYSSNRKDLLKYKDRYVWYFRNKDKNIDKKNGERNIISYLDSKLKVKEESDYLDRTFTNPETHSIEKFNEKRDTFGTLSIITNLNEKTSEEIYNIYKTRCEVEIMAENLKTTLNVDASYMRTEKSMEGWAFVNHLALIWYYKIYNLLLENKKLSSLSVNDFLMHLESIKKIKINEQWHTTEINSKTKKLLKQINLPTP